VGEVGLGVLPGVEDDRQAAGVGQGGVAGGEFIDDGGELGDVGPVSGVGVPGHRDPAVTGDDQAETDQAQVVAFLLGVPALGDRCLGVARVDERREVRHVQRERGQIQVELADHPRGDRPFRVHQGGLVEVVHRVPEVAVVARRRVDLGESGSGGGGPPVREGQFRARRDHPVRDRQRQVRSYRRGRVRASDPDRLVDRGGDPQPAQHRPDRGQVSEALVLHPLRHPGLIAGGRQPGEDLLAGAQVLLLDDPRFAVHPRGSHQVVVRLVPTLLPHNRRHIWVIHFRARHVHHRHARPPRSTATSAPRAINRTASRSNYPGNSR
jgi:hypothetical protein